MPAIGYVTKQTDGTYKGQLNTLALRNIDILISPNKDKTHDDQPDYRVFHNRFEMGAGWIRTGETSGNKYVSLSISAPELSHRLYANLGRAAGQDDPDVFAVIWNPNS